MASRGPEGDLVGCQPRRASVGGGRNETLSGRWWVAGLVLPKRPSLISFEGIDGAGKSTLIQAVAGRLADEGYQVVVTREETTGWTGEAVKRNIREHGDPLTTLFLFLADRAKHLAELADDLDAGRIVLTDRYHDSTRAYQAVTLAERLGGEAAFDGWLEHMVAPWLVVPRRTYLLDIDPEVAMQRMLGRDDLTPYEKVAFLEKVRAQYARLAAAEPHRFVILDARRSVAELADGVAEDLLDSVLMLPPDA